MTARYALCAFALVVGMADATPVAQWTAFEAKLSASAEHHFQDVEVTVEFQSPSGATHRITAFWDGGSSWKARFSPGEPGVWKWSSRSSPSDTGLDGRSGSFECVPYHGSNPLYRHGPVRVAKNRHFFEQEDGTPFFWLGDTVWNGPLLADPRDWDVFLRDRASKHFNVIQFVATQWTASYADSAGRLAYSGREKIAIDPVFFQRLDARIDAVNQHGLVAAPVLLWTGGRAHMNPVGRLPEDQAIALARYMVARYGAHQVIWLLNGDGDYTKANAAKWKRIAYAVFAGGHPQRLSTMHPRRMSWMTDEFLGEPWFRFNGYQSGHRDDDEHLRWLTEGPPATRWSREAHVPDVNLEPNYEAHRSRVAGATHTFTAHDVRRAAYWSLMVAPPAGVTYGAHGIWSWEQLRAEPLNHAGTGLAPPWREAMQLPGSLQMKHLKELFASISWWRMQPAQQVLTTQPGAADRRQFVTVLRSDDGSEILAYLPVGTSVRFRQESVADLRRARWFNPRTGAWSDAVRKGSEFLPAEQEDWILHLKR